MKRLITLRVDISEEDLAKIIPSGTVYVEIANLFTDQEVIIPAAEIFNVKDLPNVIISDEGDPLLTN